MFGLGFRQEKSRQGTSYAKRELANVKQFFAGSDKAVVAKEICPDSPGRVRYQATWWPAQCEQGLGFKPGDEVRVVGIRNITLLVEPMLGAA